MTLVYTANGLATVSYLQAKSSGSGPAASHRDLQLSVRLLLAKGTTGETDGELFISISLS